MSEFYAFAGEHPVATFFIDCLVFLAVEVIVTQPFRIINRLARSRNIVAHGWPPEYLDADGDFRPDS